MLYLGDQLAGGLKGVGQNEFRERLAPQPRGMGEQRLLVRLDADAEAGFLQAGRARAGLVHGGSLLCYPNVHPKRKRVQIDRAMISTQ